MTRRPGPGQDQLAARLGRPAWVGNVGISGYSTTEHIAFLERFELLGEMDCVLVMAGINDLGLLTLGKRRPILAPRQAPVWARTKALRLARSLEGSLRGTPFQDPLGRWIEERRELRRRAPKVPALPDLARGREEFEARLVRIAEICSGRGVRLALATQAVLWRSDLDAAAESLLWIGWVPDKSAFYEAGALRGGMDAFNAGAASVAARRGLTLIDVAAISGDRRWFYDDCHFTEAGARRVAELVAAGLPAPRP